MKESFLLISKKTENFSIDNTNGNYRQVVQKINKTLRDFLVLILISQNHRKVSERFKLDPNLLFKSNFPLISLVFDVQHQIKLSSEQPQQNFLKFLPLISQNNRKKFRKIQPCSQSVTGIQNFHNFTKFPNSNTKFNHHVKKSHTSGRKRDKERREHTRMRSKSVA